jgi:hypothetical protein
MAQYQLAGVVQGEGELVKAREIALAGVKAYPESAGGKLCFNLVQQIESKSTQTTTERVWADPLPAIKLTYKNVTKAYFRAKPDSPVAEFVDEASDHPVFELVPAKE